MRVGVVTDSAANLPRDVATANGIDVVPMILKFGDRVLLDGVDFPEGGFYKALAEQQVPVSTSGPSVGDFRDALARALAHADAVVCVTVASFVSATHDTAVTAARETGDNVVVIDSKSASLGEGFVALEAARAAATGASLDDVAARARDIAGRAQLIATINTFEFLRRSGRVSSVLAYAATTLDIKPVFAFRSGKLEQLGRPRTRARAVSRLVDAVREAASAGPLHLGICHADCAEEAEHLRATLADIPAAEVLVSEFTPLMGAHTGPGVLATAFWV